MDNSEAQKILRGHLSKFRSWSYAQLAELVERHRQAHDCLEHVEGVAPDGTQYQMEFQAVWNDKPNREVRVFGSLSAEPQKPLFGFIPIYTADATESFMMSPDGRFVGDDEKTVA